MTASDKAEHMTAPFPSGEAPEKSLAQRAVPHRVRNDGFSSEIAEKLTSLCSTETIASDAWSENLY
jgi:hypothetical protein